MRRYFWHTCGRARMLLFVALASGGAASLWLAPLPSASAQQPGGQTSAPRHRMTKVTDTIYRADSQGTPGINATSWVFINDQDVLLTDSEGSPASAKSLIEGVRTITNKPVKYLVDTHFHIDHAYGNAGLPPEIQIIGHEFTRTALLGREAREGITFTNFTRPMPGRVEALKKQVAAETDPQKKTSLEAQLATQEATLKVYSGNFPLVPPNLTVRSAMSVWSGAKEFQILWLGRAHTAGDLVVYVPSERAAASGDIVFKGMVGWQGDSFPNDQLTTIEALKKLDLDLLMPAHGEYVQGKAAIEQVITTMQAYLRDEWNQVAELKKQGLSSEAAVPRIDLSAFKGAYGQGTAPNPVIVRRIYDIIDGKIVSH